MKLIRSALADKHHLAAHRHAVFRREVVGDDPVFQNPIHSQCVTNRRSTCFRQSSHFAPSSKYMFERNGAPLLLYSVPFRLRLLAVVM